MNKVYFKTTPKKISFASKKAAEKAKIILLKKGNRVIETQAKGIITFLYGKK